MVHRHPQCVHTHTQTHTHLKRLQWFIDTQNFVHTHMHTHKHTHSHSHSHSLTHTHPNTLQTSTMVHQHCKLCTHTHAHIHSLSLSLSHTHAHTLNVCNGSSTLKIVPVAHLAGFFENTCVSVCTRVCVCTREHIHHTPAPTASLMKSPSYLEFFGVSTFIWAITICARTTWIMHRYTVYDTLSVSTIVWVSTTEWRRPVGYLKMQIIFRRRATNYRALLWKITCEDKWR